MDVAQRVGPPGHDDHDHRRAGGEQLGEQLGLHARAAAGPPRRSPRRTCRGRTGPRGRRRARRTPPRRGPRRRRPRTRTGRCRCTAQPGACTTSASRQLGAQRLHRGRHVEAEAVAGEPGQHVGGEGVAAHERERVGGARPDDGHPRAGRPPQGERGAGVEEHDRALGQLAGERAVGGRVEVDGGGAGHRALRRPALVEQPELDLLREEPARARARSTSSSRHPSRRAPANPMRVRQLDVDARGQRLRARLRRRRPPRGAWWRGTAPTSSRTRPCR